MQDFDPKVRIDKKMWLSPDKLFFEASPLPYEELIELSKRYPSLTFLAECTFECEWYTKRHFLEYKSGVITTKNIIPEYMKSCNDEAANINMPKEIFEKLETQILEIFQRIDHIVIDSDGDMHLEEYPFEVSVSAEEGDWRMTLIKIGIIVNAPKIYKKRHTFEWEEVEPDSMSF